MSKKMNIDEITMPTIYTHTLPDKKEINDTIKHYMEHGELKQKIVVTQKGMLIDGYCSYLAATVCGIDVVQCEVNTDRLKSGLSKNRTINNRKHKRKILYHRQDGKCAICGKQLQIKNCNGEDYLTFDHILPVSRGGSNGLMNLQGLCKDCNQNKKDEYKEDKEG